MVDYVVVCDSYHCCKDDVTL